MDGVLKNRFDLGVEGDVGGRNSVDGESLAGCFRELEEAADVIVLVVTGEEALRFCVRQTEDRKSDRLTKIASMSAVKTDEIAERHYGSAIGGLGAHRLLLGRVYCRGQKEGTKLSGVREYRVEEQRKRQEKRQDCDERGGWGRNL